MDIKITELKKYLSEKKQEELITEICELFKNCKEVKEYYYLRVKSDAEKSLSDKYKKIIKNEFFPERGMKLPRSQVLRNAITSFKKVSKDPYYLADLMVFYVENGVKFLKECGDMDEKFYDNITNMFEKAIDLIQKNNFEKMFERRCQEIMRRSKKIEWGFGDLIIEQYYNCFELDK